MRNCAYIHLDRIKENALNVKKRLPAGVAFCAVVKADAYGHGACRVAEALHGIADQLAVALPEEGRALRFAGENREILLMTPLQKGDEELVVRHRLTATVCRAEDVERLNAALVKAGRVQAVHIKLNTGMNRFGATEEREVKRLLQAFRRCPSVLAGGVYSHLADPSDKAFTRAQRERFDRLSGEIKKIAPNARRHLSASGGFLDGLYYDMVRIGVLLYGYAPFDTDFPLLPAMRVCAPVVACRTIKEEERVFYGKQVQKKAGQLSVVRYGYADGLPRTDAINRCMDVSALPLGMKIGQEWNILYENANELAKKYGTISYEILVRAAQRAERIYLE